MECIQINRYIKINTTTQARTKNVQVQTLQNPKDEAATPQRKAMPMRAGRGVEEAGKGGRG
jgi:hypothetical protein